MAGEWLKYDSKRAIHRTVIYTFLGSYFGCPITCLPLWACAVQVRGAFEKLYSFLAGELETAAQQGDSPLQFALMDAWGVEVHEDDHDLLARVRIFNILQVCHCRETLFMLFRNPESIVTGGV